MSYVSEYSLNVISEKNSFIGELYARGYIFKTSSPPVVPDHWLRDRFGDFYYAHDERLHQNYKADGDFALLCLGVLNDVRNSGRSTSECCNELLNALKESDETFFNELSYTCGRYVLMWKKDGKLWMVTDATGMKPAYYYNQEEKIISSHVNLVRWNGKYADAASKIAMKFGYPGIRTPITNVFLLTPNSKLDINTMSPVRFWPKAPIGSLKLNDAVDQVRSYVSGALKHYAVFYNPIVSVTAGLDSRLTLSLMKGVNNCHYFTYYRADDVDTDAVDRAFATTFSNVSGQEVNIFELREFREKNPIPSGFSEVQSENTTYGHIKYLAWVYYEFFGSMQNVLHVRSNISEVGREFWKSKRFPVVSGKDLARIYLYKDKDYKANYIFDVIERFEEFDKITGLTSCDQFVDVKSLFYWEFRMASWHSGVIAESDIAFDTVSVYNCRKTLEVMLSVNVKARRQSLILRNIIAKQWPELAEYEVNGEPFWPEGTQFSG